MRYSYVVLLLILLAIPVLPQSGNSPEGTSGVVMSFITVNKYGNNLFLDNVTIGNQFQNDAAVVSINNIIKDTSYTIGSSSYSINPKVTIINAGKNNITSPFNVTMTVTQSGYTSTKAVNSLNSVQMTEVEFDQLTVTPGQPMDIAVTTSLSNDENPANNTLNQFSIVLAGVQRKVLFEQWTSSTCGPCASNNPTVDAFISTNFDSIVAVKYHVGWPSPGNDPMYLYNTTQSYDRRYYYGVNAVPHLVVDGVVDPVYPYTTAGSLSNAFHSRVYVGTPINVTVTDVRLAGDTIQATVDVNVLSPLKAGDYRLRVQAIERTITYATAPGSNGEKVFHDVFRHAYPSSDGITIPTTMGNHQYVIKYKMDTSVWVDSMMYTIAFVQDDATHDILNCAKARNYQRPEAPVANIPVVLPKEIVFAPDYVEAKPVQSTQQSFPRLTGQFNFQLFEGSFPPANWRVVNPDNSVTFAGYEGVNGPSFGGNNSTYVSFYNYSTANAKDTLYSPVYTGLTEADSIKFDWAYAPYDANSYDTLIVKVSTDGGLTFPHTIFYKGGTLLATSAATTNEFIPTSASQWKTFSYPLATLVPVELTSFTAATSQSGVILNWRTATELNNNGFEIQRSTDGENYSTISFVKGKGTTSEASNYSYTDKLNLSKKTSLYYRLKQVDFNGNFKYSQVVNTIFDMPAKFALEQNYPNPFNPSTVITYQLPKEENVTLKVYDVIGKEVAVLVNERKPAGTYDVQFNAAGLASGMYIYTLKAGDVAITKKMALLK